jgi:hypothetical protein
MASKKMAPRKPSRTATNTPAPRTASAAGTNTDALVERLRKICLALPDAVEKVSHGEPTWFAGPKGKVFAMLDNHHHGAPHLSVWLATSKDMQETLVAAEPERYFVPPYVGAKGWVAAILDRAPDWNAIAALVRECFVNVAPPKSRQKLS